MEGSERASNRLPRTALKRNGRVIGRCGSLWHLFNPAARDRTWKGAANGTRDERLKPSESFIVHGLASRRRPSNACSRSSNLRARRLLLRRVNESSSHLGGLDWRNPRWEEEGRGRRSHENNTSWGRRSFHVRSGDLFFFPYSRTPSLAGSRVDDVYICYTTRQPWHFIRILWPPNIVRYWIVMNRVALSGIKFRAQRDVSC